MAVTDEASMLANLKTQLEAFNCVMLSAGEFSKVLYHLTKSVGVFAKAHILRKRMKLTKIANFLAAHDRKIESVATQITETQTFKKSLLQQMDVRMNF